MILPQSQEIQRIIEKLLEVFGIDPREAQENPAPWVNLDGVPGLLGEFLGYEDLEDLEDALFQEVPPFLAGLPFLEMKNGQVRGIDNSIEDDLGQGLVISKEEDLWKVFVHSFNKTVVIPEIGGGFEIVSPRKTRIDCIYHHLSSCVFELEAHNSEHATLIQTLKDCLDLKFPFTWQVVVSED